MTEREWETTTAWRELLDLLGGLDERFLTGPNAVVDERAVADGYRMIATGLGLALDTYLYADPTRPAFVDINTPFRRDRRWGGDNTDSYYALATIDPTRTYRISGQRGDSVYFSLTVYNEPSPGEWSNRIVGIVNDADLDIADDGTFAFHVGPARPDGVDGPFIELSSDATAAVTRDYQTDPLSGRRVEWTIEALAEPDPIGSTDTGTASALRSARRWLETMFAILPMPVAPRADADSSSGHNVPQVANEFAEPYQVPDTSYGWSARDACYSFASFRLADDEALAVTHRPPTCRFWNLTVWNPYMAGVGARDARTSVNHGTAVPNADGTVTVVVARERLAHPNAVSTADLDSGMLAFRWFLPDAVPARPSVELVKVTDAPTDVS